MREVKVSYAGGGKKSYVVTLDDADEAVSIEAVVKRGCDYGSHRRMFWHRRTGKPLSARGLIVFRSAFYGEQ